MSNLWVGIIIDVYKIIRLIELLTIMKVIHSLLDYWDDIIRQITIIINDIN